MANLTPDLARATPAQAQADLHARLTAQSPRRTPPPTPWASTTIHAAVLVLWVALLGAPFGLHGVWVWSAGLVYVTYDTLLLVFTFWQTLPLLRTAPPPSADGRRVSVAVIVAARDEALVLPVTLQALLAQSDPPDRILIADDGSTDATPEVLAGLYGLAPPPLGEMSTAHPQIHWLRLGGGGKARAMNIALSLIGDGGGADRRRRHPAAPRRHRRGPRAFSAEPDLVATTGVLTPVCAATASGRIMEWFQTYEYIRNFLSRYAWMRLDSLLLISGAFAGFRRTAALEVGGFDPDCLVEDYELIHRLKRYSVRHERRWTTRVLGGALPAPRRRAPRCAFLRQRRRWFGGFLQTQFWYRDMVGDRRYGALGLAMLPVKAIDTLQPLYGLTAFALLCSYAVRGRLTILEPVGGVIAAKILIDFSFQLWAIHLYRCWTGDRRVASFGHALFASIIEPFSFQLLRHLGAAWGWAVFLRGRQTWGSQARVGALR